MCVYMCVSKCVGMCVSKRVSRCVTAFYKPINIFKYNNIMYGCWNYVRAI